MLLVPNSFTLLIAAITTTHLPGMDINIVGFKDLTVVTMKVFLGCKAVWFSEGTMFGGNILPPSSGSKWEPS
jgi:hypothetical protein